MMDAKALSLLLQSCACVVFLVVVLLKFWSVARLDAFRQRMFTLRDELFDYAADGNVGFNEPAYRLLRQSMNGTIRYAHQLTFFRVFVTMIEIQLMIHAPKSNWSEDWQRALEKIPSTDVRGRLESFHGRSIQLLVNRLVAGSPFLLAMVICALPAFVLRMGWLNLKTIFRKATLSTVSHIVNTRMIENEAAAEAVA
jgi:hypothetical protein